MEGVVRVAKRIRILILTALTVFCLCLFGCRGNIDTPAVQSGIPSIDIVTDAAFPDEPQPVGQLYGSFLTMYLGLSPENMPNLPYIRVFHSYNDVETYFDSTYKDFWYGTRFTVAMASFTDEFFKENDVMILAINEPSSYLNHTAEPILVGKDEIKVNIVRHIQENAPLSPTQYHLIFTAPRGSFDGIDGKTLTLDISEVIDSENTALDAERFRIYYPEFWNFCYRADALTDNPQVVVDAINSYDELVYFYDRYSSEFDLESDFRKYVGTLYNMDAFERYVILATIIPCSDNTEPATSEAFVNNLQIYLEINADIPGEDEKPQACYLLLTAIERSDLQGVNLDWFNLSFPDVKIEE